MDNPDLRASVLLMLALRATYTVPAIVDQLTLSIAPRQQLIFADALLNQPGHNRLCSALRQQQVLCISAPAVRMRADFNFHCRVLL